MNKMTWLRSGFAVTLAGAGISAIVVACSSDDEPAVKPPVATVDAAVAETSVPDSGPLADTGVDAGPSKPKIILIHGANEAGNVRLCLATSATNTEPNLATETLGIAPLPFRGAPYLPPGFGSVLPIKDLDVPNVALTPIVFTAAALERIGATGDKKDCKEILGALASDAGLSDDAGVAVTKGVDYFVLPTVAKGTFEYDNTYVALVTGCAANTVAPLNPKCGPGYNGTANFKLVGYKLDKSSGGAGNVVQFVHGAQDVDGVLSGGGSSPNVRPFLNVTGGDAGADKLYLTGDAGATFANSLQMALPAPGIKTAGVIPIGTGIFGVTAAIGDIPQSVISAQALANGGTPDPTFFKAGRGYTFIALGDPTQPKTVPLPDGGATFNGKTVHFLVFDNDPVVPSL
jgi:hypothetical protein